MFIAKASKYKVHIRIKTGLGSISKAVDIESAEPPKIGDRVLHESLFWDIVSIIQVTGGDFNETV
jgi:hypothetical protein